MQRLKELRDQKGLSQQGLAMIFHSSQSTISAIEVGNRVPDLDMLLAMSKFFDTSIDYLAELSDKKFIIQSSDLSTDELEHLHMYRKLSKGDKEKLKAYCDGLLRN